MLWVSMIGAVYLLLILLWVTHVYRFAPSHLSELNAIFFSATMFNFLFVLIYFSLASISTIGTLVLIILHFILLLLVLTIICVKKRLMITCISSTVDLLIILAIGDIYKLGYFSRLATVLAVQIFAVIGFGASVLLMVIVYKFYQSEFEKNYENDNKHLEDEGDASEKENLLSYWPRFSVWQLCQSRKMIDELYRHLTDAEQRKARHLANIYGLWGFCFSIIPLMLIITVPPSRVIILCNVVFTVLHVIGTIVWHGKQNKLLSDVRGAGLCREQL